MLDLPNNLPAAWIALWCGVAALLAAVLVATWAVRVGLRLMRKVDVAQSLVDTHVAAVEAEAAKAAQRAEASAVGGAALAEGVAQLNQSLQQLRFLAGEVPRARRHMLRTIADIVLPTRGGGGGTTPDPFDEQVPAGAWVIR